MAGMIPHRLGVPERWLYAPEEVTRGGIHEQSFLLPEDLGEQNIVVSLPPGWPERAPYAAVFLLASDWECVRLEAHRLQGAGELHPVVIVQIEFSGSSAEERERHRIHRLSPRLERTSLDDLRRSMPFFEERPVGAGGDFLDWMRDTLNPAMVGSWQLDPNRLALAGHSMGGLLVLEALMREDLPFAVWGAASPSLWWDDAAWLRKLEENPPRMDHRSFQLSIAVGAREQDDDQQWFAMVDRALLASDLLRMIAPDAVISQQVIPDGKHHHTFMPICHEVLWHLGKKD